MKAKPRDPGSPWAIGSRHGGYDAVEPALRTLQDFDHFQQAVRNHGMEVALDFAIIATPDHPYVAQYEDIYGFDFYSEAWPDIWQEVKRIFLFGSTMA